MDPLVLLLVWAMLSKLFLKSVKLVVALAVPVKIVAGNVTEGWTWFGCWGDRCRPMKIMIQVNPRDLETESGRCWLRSVIIHELCHYYLDNTSDAVATWCELETLHVLHMDWCVRQLLDMYIFKWWIRPDLEQEEKCIKILKKLEQATRQVNTTRMRELLRNLKLCIMDIYVDPQEVNEYVLGAYMYMRQLVSRNSQLWYRYVQVRDRIILTSEAVYRKIVKMFERGS